ncbi:MAG: DUF4340 domain-containing protein [Clostridia bacterium]|nr:DUF4340 domain-containing protein [Clostridia bacterium]
MKKNIRFIIIISIVVVLLTGALFFVFNLPQNEDSGVVTDTTNDILLYDKTNLKPEEITVKNSSGEYVLIGFDYTEMLGEVIEEKAAEASEEAASREAAQSSDGSQVSQVSDNLKDDEVSTVSVNMHYTMQGYEELELSKDRTDDLAYQCSYVTALMLVDKSGSKYKDYGLDKPAATVTVVFSDNSQEILYVGDEAPDNKGRYFRRDGNANVYLMQSETVTAFLTEKLQMLDSTLTAEFDDEEEDECQITTVNISGTGYDKPVKITKEINVASVSNYNMTSPFKEACGQNVVQGFGEDMYGISGSEVAAANVTEKDIKKYGLDKPYMNISITASDDSKVNLLVSKAEKDGSCYVMTKGGKIICKMTKSDVEDWYGIQSVNFLATNFVFPNIDNMNRAEITVSDETYDYEIRHDTQDNELLEEFTMTTLTLDGEEISYVNFSTFINNVSGLQRTGMELKDLDGFEEVFRIAMSYSADDEKQTDTLVIYKGSDDSYAVTLNDRIEGYTDRDYAEKLIGQADKISGTKSIERLNTDDEESESSTEESSGESSEENSEES